MNPLEVEKCLAVYLAAVEGIAGVVPVHQSISADDIDLETSAVVVEAGQTEHPSGNLYRATVTISLRSPALSVTLADHSTRWGLVMAALEDASGMSESFADTIEDEELSIAFSGRYVGDQSVSTSDRAWINAVEMTVGIATV